MSFSRQLVTIKGKKAGIKYYSGLKAEKENGKLETGWLFIPWLFWEQHTADLPWGVTSLSVTTASETHMFGNWDGKKKSTFRLMHLFPELHKEGIRQTGNHPNMRKV